MARTLRLEFPNALYLITSRGDRREKIYDDDEDRIIFLDILGKVVTDYNWLSMSKIFEVNFRIFNHNN